MDISYDPEEYNNIPFSQLEGFSVDHNGKRYRIETMGVMIEIPKGAIEEGLTVNIKVGIAMHGPFSYPTDMHPISPILFLCPQEKVQLLQPIKIVLPHFIDYSMQDDPGMILLKAYHDYHKDGKYHFKPLNSKTNKSNAISLFKEKRYNYCRLSLDHFCFICVGKEVDEQTARKFKYSLTCVKPIECKNCADIYIYLSFDMPNCKEVSIITQQ